MLAAEKNLESFGSDRYLIIRYEDLTADLENVTKRIARFLGISWEKSLLESTNNNRAITANSMYPDRQVSGRIIHDPSFYWQKELSRFELRTVRSIFSGVSKSFGVSC